LQRQTNSLKSRRELRADNLRFSAARRTLTPERNALGLKILEACECLLWWWRNGVVAGRLTAGPMTPRVQFEAQFVTGLLGDAALDEEDVE
jgi:hypothetical protein